jgi:hypothetical protein
MAKHKVQFSVPKRPLGSADVEFDVTRSNEKLGRLKVSKGSIVWVQKNNEFGHKMGWEKFDELMQKGGIKGK